MQFCFNLVIYVIFLSRNSSLFPCKCCMSLSKIPFYFGFFHRHTEITDPKLCRKLNLTFMYTGQILQCYSHGQISPLGKCTEIYKPMVIMTDQSSLFLASIQCSGEKQSENLVLEQFHEAHHL